MTTTSLPTYTWAEATAAGLATARGFAALGIPSATVRQWASRGLGPHDHKVKAIAVGVAPGGAKLYSIAAITRLAELSHL